MKDERNTIGVAQWGHVVCVHCHWATLSQAARAELWPRLNAMDRAIIQIEEGGQRAELEGVFDDERDGEGGVS